MSNHNDALIRAMTNALEAANFNLNTLAGLLPLFGSLDIQAQPSQALSTSQPPRKRTYARRTKLTDQERAELIASGGCLYCRKSGHLVADCADIKDLQARELADKMNTGCVIEQAELPFTVVKAKRVLTAERKLSRTLYKNKKK